MKYNTRNRIYLILYGWESLKLLEGGEFMKRKISLFLTLVLIITLFAGCGGGADSNGNSGSDAEPMDIIYYAFNSEPILNWDPSVMFSNGIVVLNNVYETLLKFDGN